MAMETTFWGFIYMNLEQADSVKQYLAQEDFDNRMIDKHSILSTSSRGITLAFGKVVRGGFEEKDFWFNELESFLKNIEAFYSTVCFEFEDKKGIFVYNYSFSSEPPGWTIYENHFDFNWDDANSRFLSSV